MNKKGFIISTTLYSIFGVMLITVATILFVLSSNRLSKASMTDKLKMCIEECGTPSDICSQGKDSITDKILDDNVLQTARITADSCASGLFADVDNDGLTYFFRGDVNNNYIKFGKDPDNNDLVWRILRINGDGTLRIALDENIDYKLVDVDGNSVEFNNGDWISRIYPNTCSFTSCDINFGTNHGYIYQNLVYKYDNNVYKNYIDYDNILSKNTNFTIRIGNEEINILFDSLEEYNVEFYNNSIEKQILDLWATQNKLLDNNLIVENKTFCNVLRYEDHDNGTTISENYFNNNDFKCTNEERFAITKYDFKGENSLINSKIGYINLGEVKMQTNPTICENDNFLLNNGDFMLSSISKFYSGGSDYVSLYKSNRETGNRSTFCNGCVATKKPIYLNMPSDENGDLISSTPYFMTTRTYMIKFYLYNIKPVINLKADIKLSGDGTIDNPYIVIE